MIMAVNDHLDLERDVRSSNLGEQQKSRFMAANKMLMLAMRGLLHSVATHRNLLKSILEKSGLATS